MEQLVKEGRNGGQYFGALLLRRCEAALAFPAEVVDPDGVPGAISTCPGFW